jgi:hypothetical protein
VPHVQETRRTARTIALRPTTDDTTRPILYRLMMGSWGTTGDLGSFRPRNSSELRRGTTGSHAAKPPPPAQPSRHTSGGLFWTTPRSRRHVLLPESETLQARRSPQRVNLVGALPCKLGFGSAKMAKSGGLAINRSAKVERFDDPYRGQLEVLAHEVRNS